jgi:hypothetical protein
MTVVVFTLGLGQLFVGVYGLGWSLYEAGYVLGNGVSVPCCVSLVPRRRQQLSGTPSGQRVVSSVFLP